MRRLYYYYVSLIFILIVSCGLPTLQFFLNGQINVEGDRFTIIHETGNNSLANLAFYGYQLYYKLYKTGDTDTAAADRDYITADDRVPSESVLSSRRFRRVSLVNFNDATKEFDRYSDDSVIVIPAGTTEIILNFLPGFRIGSGDTLHDQARIGEDGTIILQRTLNNDTTSSFFKTPISKDDDDIKSMIPNYEDGEQVEVVIAILPRGLELSSARLVYGIITTSNDSVVLSN